ncbi:MAG: hypothetical protein GXO30_02995, partial [Epsilonproteobacteria bacterium]|nr:hypothetical protein [Campylobacterota bacterium]
YDEHSLYSVDKKTRDMYFTKVDDNKLSISRDIKKDTFFKQQNIFSIDVTKEKYDVILSRNMFIYFDEIKRIQATQIIIDMLNEGGIFIKGHADYIYKNKNLKNIAFGIYKKIYN